MFGTGPQRAYTCWGRLAPAQGCLPAPAADPPSVGEGRGLGVFEQRAKYCWLGVLLAGRLFSTLLGRGGGTSPHTHMRLLALQNSRQRFYNENGPKWLANLWGALRTQRVAAKCCRGCGNRAHTTAATLSSRRPPAWNSETCPRTTRENVNLREKM